MTPRERFLHTLTFGSPDRIPLQPGGGRESTLRNWHRQGLPVDVENVEEFAYRCIGGTFDWPSPGEPFTVNERMIPMFEEVVLEQKTDSRIVQDWKGNICEISNDYTVEYLRNPMDFVTRRWLRCPVENRSDWEAMQQRYDPETPERLPSEVLVRTPTERDATLPLILTFSGPFWQMREWLGFERLCMLFLDDPTWVREMVAFWGDYLLCLLKRVFHYVVPDMIIISEDIAYKRFPMISPAMAREFLLPVYRTWGEIIFGSGCPLYAVDSDGYIADLIPVWMEAEVNVTVPVEIAAGNDVVELRRRFGKGIAMQGGVDKRAIAKGGEAIRDELNRLDPVLREGGLLPTCDHAVPADVSWPNYLEYVRVLAEKTGWL
jgi:hypothetical protein